MNIVEDFSRNAGKLWSTLNVQGQLSEAMLMNTTKMNENAFYAALGWLARENKVQKSVLGYRIGQSNLGDKIGGDAQKLWELLSVQKEVDISVIDDLAKSVQLEVRDAYAALGWLACEKKIESKNIIKIRE